MDNELGYQERTIKVWINELNSIFFDIQNEEQYEPYGEAIVRLGSNFAYLARKLFNICVAYFDGKGVPTISALFNSEIFDQLGNREYLLESSYHEESGENYSSFISTLWSYLNSFQHFETNSNELLTRQTGITYLEHILENTAVIMNERKLKPESETQVYNAVKIVCQSVFKNATFPSESFQKMAKMLQT